MSFLANPTTANAKQLPTGVGRGFPPSSIADMRIERILRRGFMLDEDRLDETHVGLRIMRERAQTIGARLDVVSAPGKGSSVILTLPPNVHPVSSLASTVTTSIEA